MFVLKFAVIIFTIIIFVILFVVEIKPIVQRLHEKTKRVELLVMFSCIEQDHSSLLVCNSHKSALNSNKVSFVTSNSDSRFD
jgi:uncharacterized membrane protein YhaH (DUF805 family)